MSFIGATSAGARPSRSVSVARWPGFVAAAATFAAVGLLLWRPGTDGYAAGYVFGAVVGPAMAVAHRFSFERCQKDPVVRPIAHFRAHPHCSSRAGVDRWYRPRLASGD